MEAYPLLNKNKLKTELALIYSNDEFKSCDVAVAVYQLFMRNNLQDTFSETVALLKIITPEKTTPAATVLLSCIWSPQHYQIMTVVHVLMF